MFESFVNGKSEAYISSSFICMLEIWTNLMAGMRLQLLIQGQLISREGYYIK